MHRAGSKRGEFKGGNRSGLVPYYPSRRECGVCPIQPKCAPSGIRTVQRSIYEPARERAKAREGRTPSSPPPSCAAAPCASSPVIRAPRRPAPRPPPRPARRRRAVPPRHHRPQPQADGPAGDESVRATGGRSRLTRPKLPRPVLRRPTGSTGNGAALTPEARQPAKSSTSSTDPAPWTNTGAADATRRASAPRATDVTRPFNRSGRSGRARPDRGAGARSLDARGA